MILASLFKPKRRRRGKLIVARHFRIRWKSSGDKVYREKNLCVADEQVAMSMMTEFIREKERESAGIIPPRPLRDAAQRSLKDHLHDFLREKSKVGKDRMYLYNIRKHVEILLESCGWQYPRDITAESFQAWRAGQPMKAKTLNTYLSDIGAVLNWMKRHGRLVANPLASVERMQVIDDGSPIRALTDDEVARLLSVCGDRKAVYLTALITGLRRSELVELEWQDVVFNAPRPYVRARPSTTKNKKSAVLWLRDDVAAELQKLRPEPCPLRARVFGKGVPDMEVFRNDLRAAKIDDGEDEAGRKIVLHSLRHTLATNLQRAGVPVRVAMEYMRHSDMRLTNRVYTDATMLPTSDAVDQLPRWAIPAKQIVLATGTDGTPHHARKDTQEDTQNLVSRHPAVSSAVNISVTPQTTNRPEIPSDCASLASNVAACPAADINRGSRIRT